MNKIALLSSVAAFALSGVALAEDSKPETPPTALAGIDLDAATGEAPDPLAPTDGDKGPRLAPGGRAATSAPPPPAIAQQADHVIVAVRQALVEPARSRSGATADRDGLIAFYDSVADGKPVWVGPEGFTQRATLVLNEIKQADDWGLKAAAFDLPTFPAGTPTTQAMADLEIKVATAVLTYARHARGGRFDPRSLSRLMDQQAQVYDPRSVLEGIATADDADGYLRRLHPHNAQFEKLRLALVAARREAVGGASANTGVVKIPAGIKLQPGQRHEHIALLRQRLAVVADAGQEQVYDEALVAAVQAYQTSQGLEPTGIVTSQTRTALNAVARRPSSAEAITRLTVNMERWRWLPDDLGAIHVWDSVPDQTTQVIENGTSVLTEKIVVGKTSSPTPMFSADMQFVIFHPEWGVPDGIKSFELAPQLRKAAAASKGCFLFCGGGETSADVLKAHDLRISMNGRPVDPNSVNWDQADIRQFQFTQPAGAKNVLGMVKFRFPNKHDVYMHDTPERHLFNGSVRAFSHGCMRVQNPMHLAEVLLAHDRGWDAETVRSHSQRGEEIKLTKPIPVHITYFTAWADDDGKVAFKPDLYGLDSKVASALDGRSVVIATGSLPPRAEGAERVSRPVGSAEGAERLARPTRDARVGAAEAARIRRGGPQRNVPKEQEPFNPLAALFGQ
jgi:L,D-transpeptidase YcbB